MGPRLAAIAVLAVASGWLATATLQQDFAAYYTAGAAVSRGLDPYVNHLPTPDGPWDGISIYRHSRFLYPPLVAHLFRPVAAVPFAFAKALFTAASLAAFLLAMSVGGRDIGPRTFVLPPPWPCALWLPVLLTLERGQVDLLLLALLALAWHRRERTVVAGPLLAVAAMFKPMLVGILVPLLFARRYRWVGATVGALVLLAACNVVIAGRAPCDRYLREVLPRAAQYGEGGPAALLLPEGEMARAADDLAEGVARIDGRGRAYLQELGSFRRNASLSRLLAGDEAPPIALGVVLFALLTAPLAVGARRSAPNPAWYWGALVASVVAAPVSWAMGLVWALPLSYFAFGGGSSGNRAVVPLLGAAFAAGMLGPLFSPAWIVAGLAVIAAAAVLTIRPVTTP